MPAFPGLQSVGLEVGKDRSGSNSVVQRFSAHHPEWPLLARISPTEALAGISGKPSELDL
jgi:hypothetical protein